MTVFPNCLKPLMLNNVASTQIENVAIYDLDGKRIDLISNKSCLSNLILINFQ